jgi:PEP-CTERM motif
VKKNLGLTTVAGLIVAFAGISSASTLTVNCSSIGPVQTELVNASITCGQFNPSVGTLSSITLEIDGQITGSIGLTNNATSAQTVQGTTSSNFDLGGSLAGFTFPTPLFVATFTTGSVTLNPGQTQTFSGLASSVQTVSNTQSSTFAPYTGTGSFNFFLNTLTGFQLLGGGGQVGSSQQTNANAKGIVTYTYNVASSTPEPGTLMLLGTGLVAVVIGRRRRAAR